MTTCIIIEDDGLACETLRNLVKSNFSDKLSVLGSVGTLKEGIELIKRKSPDLIFLDIELPDDNGFSIFNIFPNYNFDVIFTTSSTEYAIPAIKHMAIDYLLKPISLVDLNASLVRFEKRKNASKSVISMGRELNGNIKVGISFQEKIALPTMDGFQVIPYNEILYCQASENYSYIHTIVGNSYLVTKTLKNLDSILPSSNFFRIHKSILLNINYVKSFSKKDGFVVTLENNLKFEVATRRQEEFTSLFLRKNTESMNENEDSAIEDKR